MYYSAFDFAVLQLVSDGDDDFMFAVRRQLDQVVDHRRESTEVGFFLHFTVPAAIAPAPIESGRVIVSGGLHLQMAGLKHGAGVALYVDMGIINFLEGFSFGEPWPEKEVITGWSREGPPRHVFPQISTRPI